MKNKFFVHYKTKNIYKVLDDKLLIEIPETEEWIEGVLYQEAYRISGNEIITVENPRNFVRSKERFEHSFSEVVISNYIQTIR